MVNQHLINLKNKYSFLVKSIVLGLCSLLISSCSIQQEDTQEKKVSIEEKTLDQIDSPVEAFIFECDKCIRGDLSRLDDIIVAYQSTITKGIDYHPYSFAYQQIKPTQSFEQCAQKAQQLGHPEAFAAIVLRPALNARIARYFYTKGEITQGAYWLQRLVNMRGEKNAYEIAGRVFIQDPRTISIGARMLAQSARLGNKNAQQMLLGLMSPGSLYYQQITTVDNLDNLTSEGSNDSNLDTTKANKTSKDQAKGGKNKDKAKEKDQIKSKEELITQDQASSNDSQSSFVILQEEGIEIEKVDLEK